jgi:hypothetical protein
MIFRADLREALLYLIHHFTLRQGTSSIMTEDTPKTRSSRWLVCSGIALISVSALCFSTTIYGMEMSFDSIAESSASARPSELAHRISLALIPSYAAWPVGILGIVLLVLGFAVRRPIVRP